MLGVVLITDGGGVYAMAMGSFPADQVRHSPDCIDEAHVSQHGTH